ncbi:hypothetical protein [Streptomyces sp. NPDC101150]|uniref:hypothetical protein n=1 Tax=Streptomyces sp. NPDC101150 TaxID=3366114 RepID=UPI0037F93A19
MGRVDDTTPDQPFGQLFEALERDLTKPSVLPVQTPTQVMCQHAQLRTQFASDSESDISRAHTVERIGFRVDLQQACQLGNLIDTANHE